MKNQTLRWCPHEQMLFQVFLQGGNQMKILSSLRLLMLGFLIESLVNGLDSLVNDFIFIDILEDLKNDRN